MHMAGREREDRFRDSNHEKADTSRLSPQPSDTSQEEVSICDILARLAPDIDSTLVLERLRQDAEHHRRRLARLQRQILAGVYHVAPEAVATAILLEGDWFVQ